MQGNYLKGEWGRRSLVGRKGNFHTVFVGLKLNAYGLVSGMLAWWLKILIGKSALLSKSKCQMTTKPRQHETRPNASDFQFSIADFLVTVCPAHPKFYCFLRPCRIIVRILVCTLYLPRCNIRVPNVFLIQNGSG